MDSVMTIFLSQWYLYARRKDNNILDTSIEPSSYPDSKVRGANMGPNWGRQDLGGPHVGDMNLAIWVLT